MFNLNTRNHENDTVAKQQTTALAEGDGNIFCLTAPACNAVFWKPRRVSRSPCGQKTIL